MKKIFKKSSLLIIPFAVVLLIILTTQPFVRGFIYTLRYNAKAALCKLENKTIWEYQTYGGSYWECTSLYTDGGKICTSGNECSGNICLIDRSTEINSDGTYTGKCISTGESDCRKAHITNGKITTNYMSDNIICE